MPDVHPEIVNPGEEEGELPEIDNPEDIEVDVPEIPEQVRQRPEARRPRRLNVGRRPVTRSQRRLRSQRVDQ